MTGFETGAVLCEPFLARLPVAGVSISVGSGSGTRSTVAASDAVATDLDALQFQLGEGPIADVLRSGRLVMSPSLSTVETRRRWPVFVPLAEAAGARALFSFPMLIGAITVGVISLYERVQSPGWSPALQQTAMNLTDATARPALELAAESAGNEIRPERQTPELRREVHQAAGMVMGQLGCSIGEAMDQLRAYSFAQDRTLDAVARSVVERTLNFSALDD